MLRGNKLFGTRNARSGPIKKKNSSSVTGVNKGALWAAQSGNNSSSARVSMTAPDSVCPPISAAFSRTTTCREWLFSSDSCIKRQAVASPAGPPPTIRTSTSIDSRCVVSMVSCMNLGHLSDHQCRVLGALSIMSYEVFPSICYIACWFHCTGSVS